MPDKIYLSMNKRRRVTLCNHNYSEEGIYHPDRIMDEYDLLYLQSGEWDIVEDGEIYHLKQGMVLLLEPGRHHYSLGKCTPKMRNVYIHFAYEDSDGISSEFANSSNNNLLIVPKLTDISEKHEIIHDFEKVIDAFWSTEAIDKELRSSLYLEELLLRLSDENKILHGETDVLVSEIVHRFHCEPGIFLSPEKLAEDYNVSIRTISGRFKKKTGMSIHQYQLNLKLNMAYDTLPVSPGRSLHDIALSYGFYDEFQFSKLFKRKFGISPSERR